MRKTLSILMVLALVAGPLPLRAQDRTPPPASPEPVPTPKASLCVKEVRFTGRYLKLVNEDGSKVSFGQSTGGTTNGAVWKAPEGRRLKVEWVDRQAVVYVSDCRPDPVPTPVPTPTVRPSPDPTRTPGPIPTPTASSTPNPIPTPQPGKCIAMGDAKCKVDDPDRLLRAGDGRFAAGSSGPDNTPGRVIEVTSAAGDLSPGTVRKAYSDVVGPTKIVLTKALNGKKIVFPPNYLLKWTKPYTTLDCSQTDARFMPANQSRWSQVIAVGATHNVIFKGCGGIGHFNEADPQMPGNDRTLFGITNFIAIPHSWDDKWNSTPPLLRNTARNILFDQIGCALAQDDCVAVYDGVTDTSVLRTFIRRGWHPTTAGSGGFRAPGDYRERRRITYAYNVWFRNGARQIRAWRGIRDWRFVRNIVANWVEYVAPSVNPPHAPTKISPNAGLWLEDDSGGENDLGDVRNNLGLPGQDNTTNGCIVGGKSNCDGQGSLPPGSPYAKCNPKMANTRWFFSGNEWGGSKDCFTNPPGYAGDMFREAGDPPVPMMNDTVSWTQILAEVGPPLRLPDEQADLDAIASGLPH